MGAPLKTSIPAGQMQIEYQVPSSCVGLIIGKGGETVASIQQRTGCKVHVQPDTEVDRLAPYRKLYMVGTEQSINAAKDFVNEIVAQAKENVSGGKTKVNRLVFNLYRTCMPESQLPQLLPPSQTHSTLSVRKSE